jgi:cytochrome P450
MTGITATHFAAPDVQRCPFPYYDRLRKEAPVYIDPDTGVYVLTRYNDVVQALKDHARFSSQTGLVQTRTSEAVQKLYADEGWPPVPTLLNNDPPDHHKFRAVVDKTFGLDRVRNLEIYIRENVVDLLTKAIQPGREIDMINEFAVRLPLTVISDLAGMPREMNDQMIVWADAGVESTSPALTSERELELARHTIEFQKYFIKQAAELRVKPDNTVYSAMIQYGVDGRPFTDAELVSMMQILMVAGYETTTSALGSAIAELAKNSQLAENLRTDPAQIPAFVEEILRVYSPLQGLFRKTTEDVELSGVLIPKGSIVMVRYGAANRDPEKFEEPGKIDLHRENSKQNIAFGYGIHHCVGNILARSEIRIALEELLRRSKSFAYSRGKDSWEHKLSFVTWGARHLWITVDPTAQNVSESST